MFGAHKPAVAQIDVFVPDLIFKCYCKLKSQPMIFVKAPA